MLLRKGRLIKGFWQYSGRSSKVVRIFQALFFPKVVAGLLLSLVGAASDKRTPPNIAAPLSDPLPCISVKPGTSSCTGNFPREACQAWQRMRQTDVHRSAADTNVCECGTAHKHNASVRQHQHLVVPLRVIP